MTRHEALTRAAELIRLHMSTPDGRVVEWLEDEAAAVKMRLERARQKRRTLRRPKGRSK